MDAETVQAVLDDWRTAPVSERLRAVLGFLEKLQKMPEELGEADVAALHQAGVSDEAITEAAYVSFGFNVMTRLADAFDFTLPHETGQKREAQFLYRVGYSAASLPG